MGDSHRTVHQEDELLYKENRLLKVRSTEKVVAVTEGWYMSTHNNMLVPEEDIVIEQFINK